MKRLLGTFLVVFLLGSYCLPVLAAEEGPSGITLTPAFQEVILDKDDERKEFVVSVTNTTNALLTFRVSVLDFGSLDESGGVAFLGATGDLEKKYALSSWMRPESGNVTIGTGETKDVRVMIENRDSLSPGGHYGALAFETMSDPSLSGGSTVSVRQVFSTLVFVKKIGGEIYDLQWHGEEYASNVFVFSEKIGVRFQNEGNVHLVPRGTVKVLDPFGRIVKKGIINEESGLLLPEAIRTYPVQLKELAVAFVPGFYTLEIAYRYDGNDEFAIVVKNFFFLPVPAILSVLALVAVMGWYVARRRRNTGEKRALSRPDSAKSGDV